MLLYFTEQLTGKRRIPYSDMSAFNCTVVGLPQGIEFKQPASYSYSELKRIHDAIGSIRMIRSTSSNDASEAQADNALDSSAIKCLSSLM